MKVLWTGRLRWAGVQGGPLCRIIKAGDGELVDGFELGENCLAQCRPITNEKREWISMPLDVLDEIEPLSLFEAFAAALSSGRAAANSKPRKRAAKPESSPLEIAALSEEEREVYDALIGDETICNRCGDPAKLAAELLSAYPTVKAHLEIPRMGEWIRANPSRAPSDVPRFIKNWLHRATEKNPAPARIEDPSSNARRAIIPGYRPDIARAAQAATSNQAHAVRKTASIGAMIEPEEMTDE